MPAAFSTPFTRGVRKRKCRTMRTGAPATPHLPRHPTHRLEDSRKEGFSLGLREAAADRTIYSAERGQRTGWPRAWRQLALCTLCRSADLRTGRVPRRDSPAPQAPGGISPTASPSSGPQPLTLQTGPPLPFPQHQSSQPRTLCCPASGLARSALPAALPPFPEPCPAQVGQDRVLKSEMWFKSRLHPFRLAVPGLVRPP